MKHTQKVPSRLSVLGVVALAVGSCTDGPIAVPPDGAIDASGSRSPAASIVPARWVEEATTRRLDLDNAAFLAWGFAGQFVDPHGSIGLEVDS